MKLKRPLPKGVVLGGIVAAGLVVALLGWLVVISPLNHKATRLDEQTAGVEQQIAQNLAATAAAKTAVVAPKIRVAEVYKLEQAMPSTPDIPDLLIELDQVAKDSGVEVSQLQPSQPQSGQISITLTVNGDFFTVTDLLYRLRNLVSVHNGALDARGRLFAIDNVDLTPSGKGHGLTANVSLRAFSYVPPAPAPAPIVPAAPTGTTTTDSSSGPSAAGAP